MRRALQALGISIAVFFTLVFVTASFLLIKRAWLGALTERQSRQQVAVLDVSGMMISATKTLKQLEELLENRSIKAIVVRINSPGGLVSPSQELYEGFRRADKKVPVVISMGPLAASGGYYAALGGRKIFANPGTLTASIGVIMAFANTQKLFEWAKIERYVLTAGKLKAAGSDVKPMTPEERALFTELLNDIHTQFKAAVKERRKLTDQEIERVCDGRVMTGTQAHRAKLVDALGPLDEAIGEAKKIANLPESAKVYYVEKKEGMLRKLLLGEEPETVGPFGSWLNFLTQTGPTYSGLDYGWKVLLLSPVQ